MRTSWWGLFQGAVLLLTLASLGTPAIMAQEGGTRRALLVGIDRYAPPASTAGGSKPTSGRRQWKDLKGAVNDVRALRELLIHRWGFRSEDIVVLENEAATRQAILSSFRRHLIEGAKPGDHSLFFYAGHGSRIRNSRSKELDGKDETIVPADANAHVGEPIVVEIRDKEWNRLFSQVLDRGAWLTALFDSCHSGSISRSAAPVSASSRFLEEDERDVAELVGPDSPGHAPGQEPERREGALIVSAAQEDQQAKETLQVVGDAREWHGAFSLALIQALGELPASAPTDRLFERVTARLLAGGYQQEPAMAGPASRRRAPLFSGSSGKGSSHLRVNLIQVYAADDVELQGGAAIGLTKDSELALLSPAGEAGEIRVRITEVRGLGKSRARVIKGRWRDLKPGDEFELVRRGAQTQALAVWMPPSAADHRRAVLFAQQLAALAPQKGVTWLEDPTESDPTHLLAWNGEQWLLWSQAERPVALGARPSADDTVSRITASGSRPALFMALPPTVDVAKGLDLRHAEDAGVAMAAQPDEAAYALVGRLVGKGVEYAWLSTTAARQTSDRSRAPTMPLPMRSVWSGSPLAAGACERGNLRECLIRLTRLHYWLTVSAPSAGERFPYRLGFKRLSDQSVIERGELTEGAYRLVLRAEPEHIERVQSGWGVQPRYCYVFVIDHDGQSTQLFPNAGSQERAHLLPAPADLKRSPAELAELSFGESGDIAVHAPFGTDTYLMITSTQAIPHLADMVEAGPVRTGSPLMRGEGDWSIDRVSLRSSPASRP